MSRRLGWVRARVQALMPDTATLIRTIGFDDGMGGETEEPVDLGEVRCRLMQMSAREATEGDRPVAVVVFQALLPYGTDVQPRDQLGFDGVLYEIAGTNAGVSDSDSLLVQLRKVE